jgi:hypothetical protein
MEELRAGKMPGTPSGHDGIATSEGVRWQNTLSEAGRGHIYKRGIQGVFVLRRSAYAIPTN